MNVSENINILIFQGIKVIPFSILYKNDSGYGPLNPENEICKGRSYRDTKYFSDLLRIMRDRTRNFNVSRRQSVESVQKLFCQIYFICASISMGRTEEMRHTQGITCAVDYFHRFHNIKWSTDRCICKGNRTKWNPIRSAILLVINKIGRVRSGSPIC